MRRLLLLATVTTLLTGCVPPEGGPTERDVAGYWQLVEGTVEGRELPSVPGHRVTLELGADGTIGGNSACNAYSGTFDLVGGVFERGAEMAMTAIGCGPELEQLEDDYLRALRAVDTAAIEGDGSLHLSGEGADMVFEKIEPLDPEALAGRWEIEGYGRRGRSRTAGGDAYVELTAGGSMTGDTGCRPLSGAFVVAGDEVQMTRLSAEGDCSGDLSEQDAIVVEVLGDGFVPDPSDTNGMRLDSRGGAFLEVRRAG